MENIHHSLPKRSSSNGGYTSSYKSAYDGVFSGPPPKFGLPALAPSHEDYVEIFGGFHASRSSSIPVLDVPAIDDELELRFSSGFDYKEVFGECRGLDWTASFEDVVAQSSGGYDSSDEAWSPSQSGSLSDELDPLAGSDKSSRLSNGDAQQSLESNMQFNVSYNKSSQRVTETVLAGTTHVTKFGAVPGHTSSQYETSVPCNGVYEHCTTHVTEDINPDKELEGRAPVEEYCKYSSNPLYSDFNKHGNDINLSESHGGTSSTLDRPFITISDISLRTKPSRLPPPSRAPPALAAKRVECDGSISKHKPLKSYTIDGVAEGSAPPFFDVEEDADSSADSSTHGNKYVHAKHICSNEAIDRKEVRSHAKGHLGDFKKVEDRRSKIVGACSSFQAGDVLQLHGEETLESLPSFEGRIVSRKSAEKFSDSQGGQYCDHISEKTAGDVSGRVETEYFEVVGKDICIEPFQTMENYNSLMQHMNPEAYRHLRAAGFEVSNQNEGIKKFKVTKEVPRWDEKRLDIKRDGDGCDGDNQQQIRKLNTRLADEKEKVIPNKLACVHDLDRIMPSGAQQPVESGMQQIDHRGSVKGQVETKNVNGVETKAKPNASSKTMETEKKFVHAQEMEENSGKHEENIVKEECNRILEDAGQAEAIEKIPEKIEQEGIRKRQNRACRKENENEIMKSHVLKENEMILEETNIHKSVKRSCTSDGHERKGDEQTPLEVDKDKELLMEAGKPKVNEVAFTRAFQHYENHTEQQLASEKKVTKERKEDAFTREDNDLRFEKAEAKLDNKGGYFEIEANEHFSRYTVQELGGKAEDSEPVESSRHGGDVNWDLESDVIVEGDQLKVLDGACELDKGTATRVDKKHDNLHKLETAEEVFSCKENMELKTRPNITDNESEAGMDDPLIKVKFNKFSKNNDEFQVGNSGSMKDAVESTSLPKQMRNPNVGGTGSESTRVVTDKTTPAMVCNHETQNIISNEDDRELKMKGTQVVIKEVDIRDSLPTCPAIREPVVNGSKVEDASSAFEHNQDLMYSTRNAKKQSNGRNDKNTKYNLAAKDPKVGEIIRRESELENERIRKIEEEREREREREKDRMAVDKAALEDRERSYAEARERAAVERATAEVRQRAMAEARERLEKTPMKARSRAERAAVERATAEARQRAVEKSMAEKAAFGAHERVEKSDSDRFSVFHRSVNSRQSSMASDLHFQSTGMSNGLRHSYFSANAGAEGESPQRSKARLERYRRTAERAANALAEKNMRDLLAQKEREERNRVAEVLDAEVKRWSSGKEGNLRALLSTLQYILGPYSGWHPVPLTDVITSAAVKKAYRKATLCVHPDKLQQRGATIQQKYICEKVFDLLKEAWNKFNSEER